MNNKLLHKLRCSSCNSQTPKLTNEEINTNLKVINDWKINDEKEMIFKKVKFKNFKQALEFVNLIGELAEKEGHHPDLSLGWAYCLIFIHTHAIKGLSINDFILASKIDNLIT